MKISLKKIGLILIFLFILVILRYTGILSPVENFFIKSLNPAGAFFYNGGQKVGSFWREDTNRGEFELIKKERDELVAQISKLKIIAEENKRLKEVLDFTNTNDYHFLVTKILGKDPILTNHFIINKGHIDGIEKGMAIVSPEGILAGKVVETKKNTSIMIIPTDNNFETAVAISGKNNSNTAGTVRGERGLGIKMEFIRQGEDVKKDDIAITSGLESSMPQGLVVGRVAEVTQEDKIVFGSASITPLISYENLSVVMAIISF